MKKMIKNIFLLLAALMLTTYGCVDLDLLDSPNNLNEEQVDLDYMLNDVQENFALYISGDKDANESGINTATTELSRMKAMFGSYTGAFSDLTATSVDQLWYYAYLEVLQNGQTLIEKAEATSMYHHAAIAQVLSAYTLVNLVDCFGDIPYSEALDAVSNTNPKVDDGEEVYNAAFSLLDLAEANFDETAISDPNDYFYGGDTDNWKKLINTLRLKMNLQMRKLYPAASKLAIDAIISSGDYIKTADEDFQFTYSKTAANPDSRHPDYKYNYGADGGNDYMGNWYINALINEKVSTDDPLLIIVDPRVRYYLYRQVEEEPSGDNLRCDGDPDYDYCYVGDYYWGRDHGDDEGVPPDGFQRTLPGVYPAGGAFDGDDFLSAQDNPGAEGAGILPIMLSSYVDFMLAEANLVLETTGDARDLYESGIRKSIDKVIDFGAEEVNKVDSYEDFVPTESEIDEYVASALFYYDNAADDDERLNFVVKEYFLALWGCGVEAYNTLRRTGYPSDIQDPVITVGAFPLTFQYPATMVQLNSSVTQKLVTEKVFWDVDSPTLN